MNEQETIKFILQNSSEPVIKNPILQAALREPRPMAQGERLGYQDGKLVDHGPEFSRRGTPKVKGNLLKSRLLKDKQKAWKEMKELRQKFIKQQGRVPNKTEFAKFSGYSKEALTTAQDTINLKLAKGPTQESATAGAYKRGEVIRAKPVDQPTVTRKGPKGQQVRSGVRWPNEKVKKEILDQLRLRFKYPRLSAEGKAAGVLSNAELKAKYFKPTTADSLVKEALYIGAREAGIKPDYPSVFGKEAEKGRQYAQRRKEKIKKVSDWSYEKKIKGTLDTHLHHMQSKRFNVTTRNLGYAPPKMNVDKLLGFEKQLDSLYIQREKLLKDKPKDLIKKLEDINVKGMNIAADPKVKGYLNFKVMDPKTLKMRDHGANIARTIDPADLLKGKAIKDLTQADKDLIELNRATVMKREKGPLSFPKGREKRALQELMKRTGSGIDPILAGRAVVEETGSLLKKPMTKTLSVLKNIFETRTPLGGAFWAAEAPLLILQGAYGRYANERDFRKALKETGQFDDKTINLLGETYGQEKADLGNVGLESYAVDQTDTSQFREDLKKSGVSMEDLVKMGDEEVGIVRDKQAAAKEIEKQRIEDAYKKEIGRRTVEFKKGGRVSFKLGGMGRRGFLKLLAALGIGTATAGTGLIKLGGKAVGKKAAVQAGVDIATSTPGMPSWFPALVNKIVKEGDDVTAKIATQERQVVHTKKIDTGSASPDDVTIYRDLDTGDIRVEVDSVSNMGEAPIQMEYKAPSVIDEGKMKGKKTDSEFSASESEPSYEMTSPDDAEVNWDRDNIVGNVDDLMSDTTKLKNYAEGKKPTLKEIVTRKRKTDEVNKLNTDSSAQVDYSVNKFGEGPDYDDFASGGRVSYFDGGIVSLKKKW